MTAQVNIPKLIALTVIALGVMAAMTLDALSDEAGYAILMLIVGYIVGNAEVTERDGPAKPVVSARRKV